MKALGGRAGVALGLWLLVIAAFWLYAGTQEAGALALMQRWLRLLAGSAWGPVTLFGLFLLRPLLLLPVTILNVFVGFLFGPLWGLVYASLATLASSSLAYGLARFLATPGRTRLSRGWLERLRARGFETVLTGRLVFLPGDLINYASGALRVSFAAFALATALGGLPGLAVCVLAGASLEGPFRFEGVRLNGWFLLASALVLGSSLALARWLRARRALPEPG